MERSLRRWWPLFVLPTLAAFSVGFLWPFLSGLYLSFCRFTTISNASFVGLQNYGRAFTDGSSRFVHALWFTALFALCLTVLVNAAGLAAALGLSRGFRGTNLFRTVFFMPNLIGGIVLGWLWQVLLNGLLARWNVTLSFSEWYGFGGMVLVMLWQQAGYMMILYIAGLAAIPESLSEAAAMDGANSWQLLMHVRLPMLKSTIAVCTFLTLTNGLKLFDLNLSLTAGMPSGRSELLALNIYNTFYGRSGWEGVGQAKAVVFCLIVGLIGLLQLHFTGREVET